MASDPTGGPARGQTTIDFTFGISVFLLIAGLVFTTVPLLVDSTAGEDVTGSVVADRAADRLARDVLAAPGRPSVLNASATRSFFEESPTAVRRTLAVDDGVRVNVTLKNATGRLAVGPTPPEDTDSVYTAQRVVTLAGVRSDLRVSVW